MSIKHYDAPERGSIRNEEYISLLSSKMIKLSNKAMDHAVDRVNDSEKRAVRSHTSREQDDYYDCEQWPLDTRRKVARESSEFVHCQQAVELH